MSLLTQKKLRPSWRGICTLVLIGLGFSSRLFAQDSEETLLPADIFWRSKSGDTLVKERQLSEEHLNQLKHDRSFWYVNGRFPKKEIVYESNDHTPLFQRTWFQTLLWLIVIAGFAGVLMWYLSENEVGLFRRKSVQIGGEETGEGPTDIFGINYQKEIDRAIREGDYRLAIRLMFLRLLKDLSEKNVIQYADSRTNLDYLGQLYANPHYNEFFRIARAYEFSWYGKFPVDESTFRVIQQEFNHFNRHFH